MASRVLPKTGRLPTSWPLVTVRRGQVASRYNALASGRFFIEGTTKIDDTPDIPVSRLVRVFMRATGYFVAEQWSAPATGHYRFDNLRYGRYFVVAHDHTLDKNGVIKDEIKPEPMV